jgi:hypothetical protein
MGPQNNRGPQIAAGRGLGYKSGWNPLPYILALTFGPTGAAHIHVPQYSASCTGLEPHSGENRMGDVLTLQAALRKLVVGHV